MLNDSPFVAIKDVEAQLKALLREIDVATLELEARKAAATIKRLVVDVRLDVRDYELSETRTEQLGKATDAQRRLQKLHVSILALGNALGPADVAQLSAQIEQINAWLK